MHFEPIDVQPPPSALRHRLRWLFAGFVVLLLTVYGRLIALECATGRNIARWLPNDHSSANCAWDALWRGDGTVLAYDQPLVDLAMNYRWLEEPADERWLLRMARARLTPAERRDSTRVAQEEQEFLAERRQLWQRLTSLCGLTDEKWRERCERISAGSRTLPTASMRDGKMKKTRIRQLLDNAASANSLLGWLSMIGRSIGEALSACDDTAQPRPLTVEEELADHVVCQDLPLEVVAEIETHPQSYPGCDAGSLLPASLSGKRFWQRTLSGIWVCRTPTRLTLRESTWRVSTNDWLGARRLSNGNTKNRCEATRADAARIRRPWTRSQDDHCAAWREQGKTWC